MEGYRVIFSTLRGRSHRGKPICDWLIAEAKKLGIDGVTIINASEGYGRDKELHSAGFFELTDQPVEIVMLCDGEKCDKLLKKSGKRNYPSFMQNNKRSLDLPSKTMQNKFDEKALKTLWLSFLYKETIENDRHSLLDKKAALGLDSRSVFDEILKLQTEQKRAVAVFLYQHTSAPPLSYQAVASRFDIEIAAINGILSYGRYLFFNILSALLEEKND